MKYIDLNDKSLEDLNKMLKEAKVAVFTLKTKLRTMQLTNTSEIRTAKKDIAKILTAISAKQREV